MESQKLDALIVGAGFGGVYQLKKLRDAGFHVKLIESGSDYGGVWYWNRYPGARVDSAIPVYEFSDPALWKDWHWTQRFPGSAEIRAYFKTVADKWDLRKDTEFNTYVNSAIWNDESKTWRVSTANGKVFTTQFFLPNTGFAAKRHTPDFKGIDRFKGTWVHSSYWPKEEPYLKGRKIAVIGTGSTGLQLTQDLAPLASEFVLFQRTPNLALPMKQEEYPPGSETQCIPGEAYPALFAGRAESYAGFDFSFMPVKTFDHDEKERQETYQKLWDHGDFRFWLATYQDMLFDDRANTEAYNFWRDKVRARLDDERLKDKFAPMEKPHAFGCKRVSLENGFYELFNKKNVHLVDVNETPITEVTPAGIKTTEKEWEFDYIVCATGFDAITGGILQMNVEGINGLKLKDKWMDGTKTFLGLSVADFPNMFFTYGPQAPTAFCNGPSCAELQGTWIVDLLSSMRQKKQEVVNASAEAEKTWAESIWAIANTSLIPTTKSVCS
ncbi:hypothetical protein VHEMI08011 [[Torrubiella] hemipterigena]|uniref:FAD/NAD(P)-binding domain-containing protein n=1 Tax=[Torrubiella] hemipterigena TaxID=1531966 RepID=A0A0A1TMF0_9HYPO|nr:hypothetical protein VHEMI08011 [[Torrubiella] hemipterigena]